MKGLVLVPGPWFSIKVTGPSTWSLNLVPGLVLKGLVPVPGPWFSKKGLLPRTTSSVGIDRIQSIPDPYCPGGYTSKNQLLLKY